MRAVQQTYQFRVRRSSGSWATRLRWSHVSRNGHGHSHIPGGEASMASLLALDASGVLVPCPFPLVLLLSAAFRHLPLVSAAVIVCIGAVMTWVSLRRP